MYTLVIFVAKSHLVAHVPPAFAAFALTVSMEVSTTTAANMGNQFLIPKAQVSVNHCWLHLLLHLKQIQAIFIQLGWIKVFQANRP